MKRFDYHLPPNFTVERMAADGTVLPIREFRVRRHRSPHRSPTAPHAVRSWTERALES